MREKHYEQKAKKLTKKQQYDAEVEHMIRMWALEAKCLYEKYYGKITFWGDVKAEEFRSSKTQELKDRLGDELNE